MIILLYLVQAQKAELERITIYEIDLKDDLRETLQILNQCERVILLFSSSYMQFLLCLFIQERPDFNAQYKEALAINSKLREDLKILKSK